MNCGDYTPSPKIAVTFECHEERGPCASGLDSGRMVVATQPIMPGEIAMSTPALGAILHEHQFGRRCDACFVAIGAESGSKDKALRCSRCQMVCYCSRACQAADWKAGHQIECSARKGLAEALLAAGFQGNDVVKDALLACRCIRAGGKGNPEITGTVEDLDGLTEKCCDEEMDMFKCIGLAVAEYSPKLVGQTGFSCNAAESIQEAFMKFRCNNFAITDDLMISLGAGCYPWGAMLNHSCEPNCILAYEFTPGQVPQQVVRVVRMVETGDELTHSYVEMASPSWERHAELAEAYSFECCCSACKDDEYTKNQDTLLTSTVDASGVLTSKKFKGICMLPLAPPMPAREVELAKAESLLDMAWDEEDLERELAFINEACRLRCRWLNPRHIDVFETHQRAHRAAMAGKNWFEASVHCKKMIEHYQHAYPSWHPLTGIQMEVLAELYEAQNEIEEARKWYHKAYSILSISHGRDNGLVRSLHARLQELG